MHEQVVLVATKTTIQIVNYISINYDKVTSIDNQSWISIHAYVVEDFKRTPILVNLKWDTEGCTTNNLTKMIWNSMKGFGGLFDHDLVTKVVCSSVDGVATFQGIKIALQSS